MPQQETFQLEQFTNDAAQPQPTQPTHSQPTQPTQSSLPNSSREENANNDGQKGSLIWCTIGNIVFLLISILFNVSSLVKGVPMLKKVKHERYKGTIPLLIGAPFLLAITTAIFIVTALRVVSYKTTKSLTLGQTLFAGLSLTIFIGIYNNTD